MFSNDRPLPTSKKSHMPVKSDCYSEVFVSSRYGNIKMGVLHLQFTVPPICQGICRTKYAQFSRSTYYIFQSKHRIHNVLLSDLLFRPVIQCNTASLFQGRHRPSSQFEINALNCENETLTYRQQRTYIALGKTENKVRKTCSQSKGLLNYLPRGAHDQMAKVFNALSSSH